ncbi:HEAT repeat domain-containing protein, partial [Streptomyces chumphonensis]
DVRGAALRLLAARWSDDVMRGLLVERATADPHEEVRLDALRMWAVSGGDECVPVLVGRLGEDSSELVRAGIAWTLAFGWHSDLEAIAALSAAVDAEESTQVRQAVNAALKAVEALREHFGQE